MTTFTVGSRTRTETRVTTAPDVDFPDDGEPRPSQVSDQYWIHEIPPGRVGPTDGKWMLFYLNKDIDAVWRKAKSLFRKGRLIGISAMKVSTARENSRSSDSNSQVLICYCGPVNDEVNVTRYGERLLTEMDYRPFNTNPYVYYKSDQQTMAGTRATGQGKNHLYKIRVPVRSQAALVDGSSNGALGRADGDAFAATRAEQQGQRSGKRKLDTTDDVEETRKRMSCLSPRSASSSQTNLHTQNGDSIVHPVANGCGDSSTPTMTRIKIRLENLSSDVATIENTIVAHFHVGQTLNDLHSFLSRQMPSGWAGRWMLLKPFPTEELRDLSMTIADAGLANAVVIARRMD